ncbi:hypothetical protein AM629_01540 [Photorhabdus heterorhabditis]|uniref:Phage tail protein n=1 Tax=Photorhabdus heterorhabditis TaxID=880156 RepID=A0ABR5KHC8_9GAMM|nr:hypothetical protein [Photorhabdus heterorhabditis]KOY63804.1 hypothetical protein AM629_01540 [Photorhabdus heterorhabditis]
MAAYHIHNWDGSVNKHAKAGVVVGGVTILTAESISSFTDPTFQWVLNINAPMSGAITTISQLNKDLYWVRGDAFTVGNKSYMGIELAFPSPTKPKLQVELKQEYSGGYSLYSLDNEYIIIVYDPIGQRHRICLSATPAGYHPWFFSLVF